MLWFTGLEGEKLHIFFAFQTDIWHVYLTISTFYEVGIIKILEGKVRYAGQLQVFISNQSCFVFLCVQ